MVANIVAFRVSGGYVELLGEFVLVTRIHIHLKDELLRIAQSLLVWLWEGVVAATQGVDRSHEIERMIHIGNSPDTTAARVSLRRLNQGECRCKREKEKWEKTARHPIFLPQIPVCRQPAERSFSPRPHRSAAVLSRGAEAAPTFDRIL